MDMIIIVYLLYNSIKKYNYQLSHDKKIDESTLQINNYYLQKINIKSQFIIYKHNYLTYL